MTRTATVLFLSMALLACEGTGNNTGMGSATSPGTAPDMPSFDEPQLAAGRSVWMGTCRNCHLLGVSGAPAVTDFAAWESRLIKDHQSLHLSALNGIRDEAGELQMPPRGGNARLTDEQVKRAVDYMVASVRYFGEQTGTK